MARLFHRFDGPEKAPVLLLSNSLGTALEMWDPQMPVFTERFRVLRHDTRGHGRSEVPAGPYSIAELGKDVLALLDETGVGRASFCGLSMGGMIGMWLGINAPDRIDRLVLCNTSAQKIGTPELWAQRIAIAQTKGMTALAEGVIERWFTPEFRARDPEAVDKVRKMLLATPGAGYAACSAAIRDQDQLESISAIRAPTLVITGSRDPATPPEHGRAIAGRIRGARVVELEAAHLSNIEARDRFNAAVSGFLA
ncbi:MAG TPA: 3-oxoadipate enol-lactonase [Myxococcales bacterium]|nr:3-oxoadipate enol-lactonase [Myxococcales bacterium]HET9753757.1 3-oxoadipate enol-lactonase [Myxococcales bacterium]